MPEDADYFRVIYHLRVPPGEDPRRMARGIALEQTVELPDDLVRDDRIREEVIGRVETPEPMEDGRFRVAIEYAWQVSGMEIPQWLNLLFGNISLKKGIQIADFSLRRDLFPGPRWGVDGIRRRCAVPSGPLLCTALKPVGSSTATLAAMAHDLALGGLHIIKDDHGMANQGYSPFHERLPAVAEAVARANRKSGSRCLYFPNFAPRFENIGRDLELCRRHGIEGLLVSPFLLGLDLVRYLAETQEFILMFHPALSGGWFAHGEHGLAAPLVLGKLFRGMGADASIYPNVGGRFSFDAQTCRAINDHLRQPQGGRRSAFPVPAGGMTLARIPEMRRLYGEDLIFLMGGALFREDQNLVRAAQRFRLAIS